MSSKRDPKYIILLASTVTLGGHKFPLSLIGLNLRPIAVRRVLLRSFCIFPSFCMAKCHLLSDDEKRVGGYHASVGDRTPRLPPAMRGVISQVLNRDNASEVFDVIRR